MRIPSEVLNRIKNSLASVYGNRLKGVVLYGSEARGESEEDSDIDLLVVLEGPVKPWKDIRTIVHALSPIQLEVIRPIHASPVDIKDYEAGEFGIYRNAKSEGILV